MVLSSIPAKHAHQRRHADYFLQQLNANERNALRAILLTERGLDDLRHALGIKRVRVVTENERRTALAEQGRTAELFKKRL